MSQYLSNEDCIVLAERWAEENGIVSRDYSVILKELPMVRVMREGDLLVTQDELLESLQRLNEVSVRYHEKKAEFDKAKAQFEQDNMMLAYDVSELEDEYSTAKWRVENDTKKYFDKATFSDEDIPF